MIERVSRLFETCEKYKFLNDRNNFFYEIDLKKFCTRRLETYINSVFSEYNVHWQWTIKRQHHRIDQSRTRVSVIRHVLVRILSYCWRVISILIFLRKKMFGIYLASRSPRYLEPSDSSGITFWFPIVWYWKKQLY